MNIQDLMTDDLNKVSEFEAACDDMVNSKYILAEDRIIKILKTVALSTVLQQIISGALKGFDYGAAARECLSEGKLRPSTEKSHVALVFCILADIDNHKIYLNDFLRKFFWDGDINSAYTAFCNTLIVPFKNYVTRVINQAQPAEFSPDEPYYGSTTENEKGALLERKAMNLASAISTYQGYSQQQKDDYIFMCDNIASTGKVDITGARALAIGLKRLIGEVPELAPLMEEVVGELEA